MTPALSVALAALAATLAGVVGTQLGRDAVTEINPLFYRELPEPPQIYEDETAAAMRFGVAEVPADVPWGYSWARGPVCWGCPEKPDRWVDAYADPMDPPIPTAGHAAVRQVSDTRTSEEQPSDASRDVQRYMDFPITADEARRAAKVAERQLQREGPLQGDVNDRKGETIGM